MCGALPIKLMVIAFLSEISHSKVATVKVMDLGSNFLYLIARDSNLCLNLLSLCTTLFKYYTTSVNLPLFSNYSSRTHAPP